jgi:hypothetical protein
MTFKDLTALQAAVDDAWRKSRTGCCTNYWKLKGDFCRELRDFLSDRECLVPLDKAQVLKLLFWCSVYEPMSADEVLQAFAGASRASLLEDSGLGSPLSEPDNQTSE